MTDRLAVFDLDGTLIDTAPDLIETAIHVLGAEGITTAPAEVLRPQIALGARAILEMALQHGGTNADAVDMDRLHAAFLEHYTGRIAQKSRPFAEIEAALPVLRDAGIAVAICTNKREELARKLLNLLGMVDLFCAITGRDTFAVHKPHPDHLLGTIELAGGTAARAVFVGDSRIDLETARAAKVPFVGLTYGYTDVAMETLAPDRLCAPGEDIAEAIVSLLPPAASR